MIKQTPAKRTEPIPQGAPKLSKKQKVAARRLKGFQDYLPKTQKRRFAIMDTVRKIAERCGFEAVGTPALEYSEVLLGQGGETDKQVFQFKDNGDRDVALRFDLTVPFSRFIAEHQGDLILPFKRLQIGDVWRAEKPQKGRYREFCQCDLDIIGVDSAAADIEVLVCMSQVLDSLNVGGYTMIVSDRLILNALIGHCLTDVRQDLHTEVLIALDKLDKIGSEKVAELINNLDGATPQGTSLLLSVLSEKTPEGDSDLNLIRQRLSDNTDSLSQLDRLESTIAIVRQAMGSQGKLVIDLSVARGLGYYTGIVYETKLDKAPHFGSISSGGRYDNLADRFTTQHLPGVGGSVGLDRLVAALEDIEEQQNYVSADVFIAVTDESVRSYAYQLATTLRSQDIATDIALKPGKIANQFKYANRKGFRVVLTVGPDERDAEQFSLKHMQSGDEKRDIALASLVDEVKGAL